MNELDFLPPKIQGLNFETKVVTMFGVVAKHWKAEYEGEWLRFVTFPQDSEYGDYICTFTGTTPSAVRKDCFKDYLWANFG